MTPRLLVQSLQQQLTQFPAVVLSGARQAGRTTLAQTLAGCYYNLDNAQDRLRLDLEWGSRANGDQLVILDEAQAMPALIPLLRTAIDQHPRRKGRFLLLNAFSAHAAQISQALNGHMGLCSLSPLLAREVPAEQWDALWQTGGYPDGRHAFPDWQRHYLVQMAQRDLPGWGLSARAAVTERLCRMLAAVHGQPWNASQIGKALGVSYHTANAYVDVLAKAYLVRRLPAYAANIRKRLVKSPKIYWRDSGLLHALHGLPGDLRDQPWVGLSWEGWIIEQVLGYLQSTGQPHRAYYLRTSDHKEIDLVLEYRGQLWAMEIKLTSAPDLNDLKRLADTARLIGADRVALISRTDQPLSNDKAASLNLAALLDELTPP